MTRGIAYRRHQRERMIRHARHVLECVWPGSIDRSRRETPNPVLFADNLRKCSCPACNSGDPKDRAMVRRADAKWKWELSRL